MNVHPIDPRAAKETDTVENVLLLGLFHCVFLYARVNIASILPMMSYR